MDKGDRRLRIFTDGKATFGYQLNVGNTVLGALYEYYIYANKIYRPMGRCRKDKVGTGAVEISPKGLLQLLQDASSRLSQS